MICHYSQHYLEDNTFISLSLSLFVERIKNILKCNILITFNSSRFFSLPTAFLNDKYNSEYVREITAGFD